MKQQTKRKQRREQCLKQTKVFVVDKNERPLMPCSPKTARLLLRNGRARIYKHAYTGFFAIKLNYIPKKHYLQHNTIGVDTGSQNIGVAIVRKSKNDGKVSRTVTHLYEVMMRGNEITKNLDQRRMYRRNRRSRKTRYRKARWLNRRNSIKKDRISPTMNHKFKTHKKVIDTLRSLLPKHSLILEIGQFDTALMKNEGKTFNRHWGYQCGVNYGFENRKAYVLWRDGYKCRCCHKSNIPLQVHHIQYRSHGGSDHEDNLITLCEQCHKDVHNGTRKLRKQGLKKSLKDATQMNHLASLLMKEYLSAKFTYGFITKANRHRIGLPKEHYNDVVTIASKGKKVKIETNEVMKIRRVSKGDYQLSWGSRSEKSKAVGKVCGFRKFDKVKYFGNEYLIFGTMSTGYFPLMDIESNRIDFSNLGKGLKTPKATNMIRISTRRSWLYQKQVV